MILTDEQIQRLTASLSAQEVLDGRYEMIDVIGSGGMGIVYEASDAVLRRKVAVKVADSPRQNAQPSNFLMSEAQVLAKLDHPAIIPIHDAGTLSDGRPFYVMKLVRGETLEQFVKMEPSLSSRLRIFQTICDAVSFAHSVGIVHRDLNPRNVMVGTFGETFVLDWGLAGNAAAIKPAGRTKIDLENLSQARTVMGTPAFMAPEQALGDQTSRFVTTDVYGLGGILYFLLMGEPPFSGSGPNSFHEKIDPRLRSVCVKCLEKLPEDRYARVEDLTEDVSNFLDCKPVSAYKDNPYEVLQRWLVRHKVVLLFLLAYVILRLIVALIPW